MEAVERRMKTCRLALKMQKDQAFAEHIGLVDRSRVIKKYIIKEDKK